MLLTIDHRFQQLLLGSQSLLDWLQDKPLLLSLYSAFVPGWCASTTYIIHTHY